MTDDPELALDEAIGKTTESETVDTASGQSASSTEAEIADHPVAAPVAATTEEPATDDGDTVPPVVVPPVANDNGGNVPPPARRGISQFVGTLLIVAGILTILLTVGITAWNRHQHDAETQAFLSRVTIPTTLATAPATTLATTPVARTPATPFPSTVSGALVPDTAKTPTANVGTRAAQPVATTSDGKDRTILAAVPAPTATPVPTSADTAAATDAPTPTPKPRMPKPTHLTIPAINVDSDVVEVGISPVEIDGQQAYIWDVAPYAVGHNFSSANPGEGENVVLTGHDDWQGEVFKNLYKLKKGDQLSVQAGDRQIGYHVDEILLLPEVGQPLDKRLENAKFIGTTGDERLTLVTCWPYGVDDHRLIVIARPDQ
ncbi:MAG: sortase [Chloroflexota bacterium]|nr:sortase [Chloroflexota bacterium]